MKYVLKGRVVTMDAASTVLQAGAVYIDGQNVIAAQDSAAPPPPGFAASYFPG
jgi:5-methylthioadenosine/S-adenosylhomocysteine deaminase